MTRPAGSQDHRGSAWPRSQLDVPIGLGGNTFGRTSDAVASERVLDAFFDAGGTLIDTADTYADGLSETIVGTWIRRRGNRDRVEVVTKVGNHPRYDGLSRSTVTAAVEESLRRLDTDYIDLYLAHYEDGQTPVEESAEAFDSLVRAGKVRSIGLSNFEAPTVSAWLEAARSHGLAAPVALQPHYSLAQRQPFESQLAHLAADGGLAVLPYRSLAGGFLTGKYRTEADTEGRARGAGVRPLLTPVGLALVDAVQAIADDHQVAAAAVALTWLLHQPTVVAPLASASDPGQLSELLTAPTVRLSSAELERLDLASAPLE